MQKRGMQKRAIITLSSVVEGVGLYQARTTSTSPSSGRAHREGSLSPLKYGVIQKRVIITP